MASAVIIGSNLYRPLSVMKTRQSEMRTQQGMAKAIKERATKFIKGELFYALLFSLIIVYALLKRYTIKSLRALRCAQDKLREAIFNAQKRDCRSRLWLLRNDNDDVFQQSILLIDFFKKICPE